MLPPRGAWVPSLLQKLRSCMPQGVAKTEKSPGQGAEKKPVDWVSSLIIGQILILTRRHLIQITVYIYNPGVKLFKSSSGRQVRVCLPRSPEPNWRGELSLEVLCLAQHTFRRAGSSKRALVTYQGATCTKEGMDGK